MTAETWVVFLVSAYGLAVYPGPNNLLALSNGSRFGAQRAVWGGVFGRLSAFVLMIAAAAIGLGALMTTSALAFGVVKWLGVAYLLILGWRILRAPPAPLGAAPLEAGGGDGHPRRLARREFLVAIGNPKAILIFTAFFPQFLDPAAPAAPQFAAMGGAFLALESTAIILYAASGRWLATLLASERGALWINRLTGGALIGAAGLLAMSRRAEA